jgi:hypothetical protein
MNGLRELKVWLGWCPNSPPESRMITMDYPGAVRGSEKRGSTTHRIVTDSIMKEELMRSFIVYFISFIIMGAFLLYCTDIGLAILIPLSIIPAFIHGLFIVRYRRKEHIYDPAITTTWRHILKFQTPQDEDKIARTKIFAEKIFNLLAIVVLSLTYIYASVLYDTLKVLWLPVMFLVSGVSAAILFRKAGKNTVTPLRMSVLCLVLSLLVVIRYLAIG